MITPAVYYNTAGIFFLEQRVRLRTLRARAVLHSNLSPLRELCIPSGAFYFIGKTKTIQHFKASRSFLWNKKLFFFIHNHGNIISIKNKKDIHI